MMDNNHFYFCTKKGGFYDCNERFKREKEENWVDFTWKDLNVEPVGYKEKYKLYLRCKHCDKIFYISEDKIPRRQLFKLLFRKNDS